MFHILNVLITENTISFISVRINVKSFDVESVVIDEEAQHHCEINQAKAFLVGLLSVAIG